MLIDSHLPLPCFQQPAPVPVQARSADTPLRGVDFAAQVSVADDQWEAAGGTLQVSLAGALLPASAKLTDVAPTTPLPL